MCCKTQKQKAQSQCRRRRRWNNDKQLKDKMQKEEKLEEFRSFRTSKQQKQRKEQRSEQRSIEEEKVKNSELFLCQKLKCETKQLSLQLKLERNSLS